MYYLENIIQSIINTFNDVFQTGLLDKRYYLIGEFQDFKDKTKFEFPLKVENPLINCDQIHIGNNNFVTGDIELWISYKTRIGKTVVEQKESHKYKYSHNHSNSGDECEKSLDLVDFDSSECSFQESSGSTLSKILQNTQLCVKYNKEYIQFVLKGEINGDLSDVKCDLLSVSGVLKLKFVRSNEC